MKDVMIEVPNIGQWQEATVDSIAQQFNVAATGFDETYTPVPMYIRSKPIRDGETPESFIVMADQETADALQLKDSRVTFWPNTGLSLS